MNAAAITPDSTVRPHPGDVVRVDGPASMLKLGQRGVIDGGNHYGDAGLMVVFGASAHRSRPTPRDPRPTYVSVSGGPCPCIDPSELTFAGTTTQEFWHWKDIPRAGGGVTYTDTVNLWSWQPSEHHR